MTTTPSQSTITLDEQRAEFSRGRFLAMPIAGAISWTLIGSAGAILPLPQAALALFIGTGLIFYLGLLVARFTGEDLLGKTRKNNVFDRLFLLTVFMALLVYAIAIPFSGIIQHWVGLFHGVARTVPTVAAWYLFPGHRFVIIPA